MNRRRSRAPIRRQVKLPQGVVCALTQLWADLHEFPASDPDASLDHCFEGLAALLGSRSPKGRVRADARG